MVAALALAVPPAKIDVSRESVAEPWAAQLVGVVVPASAPLFKARFVPAVVLVVSALSTRAPTELVIENAVALSLVD